MSVHLESAFEREICEHLGSHGWLFDDGAAAHYDRKLALYPPDLIAWLEESQKELWETYQQKNGSKAEASLLQRLREQLDQQGTLDLLRNGIEVMGLPKALKLAEFKPALGLTQTSWPATRPTACASFGRCATRCTTRTASTSFSSSMASRWPRLN